MENSFLLTVNLSVSSYQSNKFIFFEMPQTLIKSRFNKHILEPEVETRITTSSIPQNLQSLKQKLVSGNGFKVYEDSIKNLIGISMSNKRALKVSN